MAPLLLAGPALTVSPPVKAKQRSTLRLSVLLLVILTAPLPGPRVSTHREQTGRLEKATPHLTSGVLGEHDQWTLCPAPGPATRPRVEWTFSCLPAPLTVFLLEEQRRPTALQLPLGHDGDAVPQQVSLVHEVQTQQKGESGRCGFQASSP